MVVPSVLPRSLSDRTSLKACSALKRCSQVFFFNCCQNLNAKFQGNFFKEINLGIKMQQRTRKAFTFTFPQVLTVFWPGSTFHKSSLLRGVAHLFVKWERWGVLGAECCSGCILCLLFPAELWGGCSENWVHLRATGFKILIVARESNLQDNFVDRLLFWDEHMFN